MKRRTRQLIDRRTGAAELVGNPGTSHCHKCGARVIWGQLTPRKWVMVDERGKVHACAKRRSRKPKTVGKRA